MEQKIDKETTVGEIAAKWPVVREAMERLGIDYCCGGKHTLAEAAAEKGVDLERVMAAINEAVEQGGSAEDQRDWTTAGLTELADYIEARHHTFMKEQLPRISTLLMKVKRAHGERHGTMLVELDDVFVGLREEIESHLMKEEQVLFPYIRQIESAVAAGQEMPRMHCGSIANPINQMEHEHEEAGKALAQMRILTGNYTPPPDACPTFCTLYEALEAMERDLHEHIHLENSVLFPKARDLELRSVSGR
jgi:regulator of cell morphogenesis and NO signaling